MLIANFMTPKKFIFLTLLQFLLLGFVKAWFFKYQVFENAGLQQVVFYLVTGIIAAALVRRFGPITFLEVFVVLFVWLALDLLLDLILISPFVGLGMYAQLQYWWGFFTMGVVILIFHKMNHVHKRHLLHAKH
jgi:hypothetical protein